MNTLALFGSFDWGIVGLYFALVTFVGLWISHKKRNPSEDEAKNYFLAGRSLPTWAVAISLVATTLSTATFVAVPDTAFAGNLTYLSLSLGGIIAVFIVACFFVPTLYAAGTVTIYGFLAQRFGEPARIAVSAAFILGRMLASGARLFLAAIPLSLLLFGNVPLSIPHLVMAILLIAAVGTFYTAIGGVRAVVWVDVLQFALVLLTAAFSIAILLHRIPLSLPQIVAALHNSPTAPSKLQLVDFSTDLSRPYTLLAALFGISVLNVAAFGTDQDLAQRFLITKSARGGALSVIASQFIGIVVVFLFLAIGLLLYLFYQRPDLTGIHAAPTQNGTSIYPWFLLTELPTGLAGLAVAGFFAIAQGSLDSAMNALASSVVADLWLPLKKIHAPAATTTHTGEASKWIVAAVGAALALFAIACAMLYDPHHHTLLDYVQGLMTFALSGILGVFLTALFTTRGNSASIIAALVVGPAVVTLLQPALMQKWTPLFFHQPLTLAWPWWMPIATTLSFLTCILPPHVKPPMVSAAHQDRSSPHPT
jgi:SSS family transporter